MTPWADIARMLWDYKLLVLVAGGALLMFLLFVVAPRVALYRECRAHGFSEFYCSMGR